LVWANIPREAVLNHFPLSDLLSLADRDPRSANILHLEHFEPGRRTLAVSSLLREEQTVLSNHTARAIGCVTKTFGLDGEDVEVHHIREFVGRLVDGWQIRGDSSYGIHTVNSHAYAFAATLGHRAQYLQDIMKAFVDGMQQGTANIAYYARRGPCRNTRRTRTT
jgi:hypothetical protein